MIHSSSGAPRRPAPVRVVGDVAQRDLDRHLGRVQQLLEVR
jgi:hypothetical protein